VMRAQIAYTLTPARNVCGSWCVPQFDQDAEATKTIMPRRDLAVFLIYLSVFGLRLSCALSRNIAKQIPLQD
jgi:hypothetical protein